jgi:hypothetical protein
MRKPPATPSARKKKKCARTIEARIFLYKARAKGCSIANRLKASNIAIGRAASLHRILKRMILSSKFEKLLRAVLATPVEAALFILERVSKGHEYQPSYEPELDWEARLHSWLRAPWPGPERTKLDLLLARHRV